MLKKITKWETEDGKVFDTQDDAEDYMFEQEKEVMTHNAEQERVEFEDLAIDDAEIMALEDCFAKCSYTGEYEYQTVRVAFRLWQAARRTPAAPVPQWDGKINPADFNVQTFRSSGNGWLVKPDNCVRITHVPTGLFEEGVSERSIHTNKAEAWERLSARLESLATTQPAAQDATVLMGYMHPGNFERHQHSRWKTGAPCALRLNGWTGEPLQVAVYARKADVDAALAAQAKQGEQP